MKRQTGILMGILALALFVFNPVRLYAVSDEAAAPAVVEPEPSEETVAATETGGPQTPEAPEAPAAADPSSPVKPSAEEPAAAPETAPVKASTIVEVQVSGNQIVSTNTILSKVRSQKGEKLAQEIINDDIKRLYATNFFQDIRMDIEEVPGGYRLIVRVDEKPIIRRIRMEGFTAFKEDQLRKELKIIEGQILDRRAIKEGEENIRKMYAGKGYRFIDIKSSIDINETTKEATITLVVIEGEKFKIEKVQFEGVTAFPEKKLRKMMKTRRAAWYLLSSGALKEDNFQQDLERIRLYYQQEGYLDGKVEPRFDYDQDEKKIVITIVVEEGMHYQTGEIRIEGNEVFPENDIWQELEMLPGATYSQFYLFSDIEKIRDFYQANGYMDVRVLPDVNMNRDTGKVDVRYQIEEGELSFVEQVVVRGNTKTKDIVIRRELRIRPGDRFDGEAIQKSKQRLENLDYFEEVTYDTEPVVGASNRKNIVFRVKEKRTGELSFGGGVSSVDKLIGFAQIAQKNFDLYNFPRFTGGGQSLSVGARIGSISQDYNINFVEPYLFNKPVTLGVDAFNVYRDNTNVDFEQKRLGLGGTLSRLFRDVVRFGGGYTIERVTLEDLSDDAPKSVRDFDGSNWLSRLKAFSSYDTRDSLYNPSKGILVSGSAELIGSFLGGDQDYYIFQSSMTKYWRIFKKHLLEWQVRLATSDSFGSSDTVPVFDRFFAGGLGSVRGFNYRRVGPIEGGDAVGGQTLGVTNFEYTFPLPRLDAFRGAVFLDAASVNRDSYKMDFSEFSVSIGPGIKIKTPVGPLAFYYGYPIANRDTEDRNGKFEFSLSRGL
ncbi:MAG: outer membrane protein assembly factor BamA [Candidatus Omnitrophota bacterium]